MVLLKHGVVVDMLHRLIAITVSLFTMAAPTQAGLFLDERHQVLVNAIHEAGISYEINANDCPGDIDGFYTGDRIVICQDYGSRGAPERKWTINDLDTLRHEAVHLAQDCRDGAIDMMIDPPSTEQVNAMIDRIGADRFLRIWKKYHNRQLYMDGILVELEAFYKAQFSSPEQIAKEINTYCPRIR